MIRLYHSLQGNLPDDIKVIPSFKYKTDFANLQEKLSNYFRGAPDLIFKRRGSLGIVNVNVGNSSEVINVDSYDEDITLLELKHPGPLMMSRSPTVALPHAFGQVAGNLYLLAVCKILHHLMIKKEIPSETISIKGLLVKRKDKMVLFKLQAAIKKTIMSEMVSNHLKLKDTQVPA